jgi:hypothetical protein
MFSIDGMRFHVERSGNVYVLTGVVKENGGVPGNGIIYWGRFPTLEDAMLQAQKSATEKAA